MRQQMMDGSVVTTMTRDEVMLALRKYAEWMGLPLPPTAEPVAFAGGKIIYVTNGTPVRIVMGTPITETEETVILRKEGVWKQLMRRLFGK